MEHSNNEHSLIRPASIPDALQAPASLVPAVLKRLEEEQAALPPGTPPDRLIATLHDALWSIRARAVFLLGEMDEQAPIEPLIAALHDEDANVRMAAIRALGKLGTRAPLDQLKAAQHDPDWLVQETAAFTVAHLEKQLATESVADKTSDGIEEDSESDDTFVEITPLPGSDSRATLRSIAQNALPAVPRRKTVQRITQGLVAALLITGIALSWLAIAQRLHPAASGHVGNSGATPAIAHSPIPSHAKQGTVLFTYRARETVDYPIWSNDNRYMTFVTESNNNDSANVYVWSVLINRFSKAFSLTHLPPQNWSYESDGINFLLTQPGRLQIWNAITGNSLFAYQDHSNQQPVYAWSNDSQFIAIAINPTTLRIWNVKSLQVSLTIHINVPAPYTIMWSPDDSRIAVQAEHFAGLSQGGIVAIYSALNGNVIATINDSNLIDTQWSPDGKYLLSSDLSQTSNNVDNSVWNAETGNRLSTHSPGAGPTFWMCNDQRLFATKNEQDPHVLAQQVLEVWDASTGKTIYMLPFTGPRDISGDCKYFALTNQNTNTIYIVDAATGHTLVSYHTPAMVEALGFSNNSQYLALASQNSTVEVRGVATDGVYYTYHVASNTINIVSWSPDDRLIAITSPDNIVQVLQVG